MKLFGNLFAGLFGGTADKEKSWGSEDTLELELEQAWDQVQKLAREQVARREEQLRTKEADEDLQKTEHEKFQSELWESILDLHRNLETGLDEDIVPRLRTLALGHSFGHREPVEESLEERIDHFVLRELFFRCAERAWDRLVFLMNKCDVVWPQPPDLSYRRPPESVAEFAEKRLEELQLEFSRTPLDKQADLAVGEIKVWAHTYPEKDSWLWRQTSLCGVGAGLHLQLFVTALELWLWRSDRLEQALRRQIEKELVEAKKLLSQGVVTLEDAERVAERAVTLARPQVREDDVVRRVVDRRRCGHREEREPPEAPARGPPSGLAHRSFTEVRLPAMIASEVRTRARGGLKVGSFDL